MQTQEGNKSVRGIKNKNILGISLSLTAKKQIDYGLNKRAF